MITVFNPAPFDATVCNYPLECVDVLILNQTEAQGMLGHTIDNPAEAITILQKRLPHAVIIMTLGADGVAYALPNELPQTLSAYPVKAVDTTGAGDTFVGYAMNAVISWFTDKDKEAFARHIDTAVLAAGLSVTRRGAVDSIPSLEDVQKAQHQI